MALTEKQRRFVTEYMVDANATQAAIRAGYSERSAGQIGESNMKKHEISEAIESERERLAERTNVTAEKIWREFAKVGFENMRDFATWNENGVAWLQSADMREEDLACVQEVSETTTEREDGGYSRTMRLKLHSKMEALKELAKLMGMYPSRGTGAPTNDTTINNTTNVQLDLSGLTLEEIDAYREKVDATADKIQSAMGGGSGPAPGSFFPAKN